MATKTWTGNAHSVRQITTITVANTWAAADTATCTINGKDLVITCGSTTTTTALVATAIKEAWMSATRLDGTSASSNATSNFGGQEFGEFREMTASVSGSVVTLVGVTAGKPITLTVTEVTAGTGTATGATAQAATGRNHWDNADNWSDGIVPANDDVVIFKDTDVSVKYGMPDNSGTPREVTIQTWRSFTGEVGLPAINRDDPSYPYPEYRQRYLKLNDAGTGSNIAHRFGLGQDGVGFRLFNLHHATVTCSPIVYHTNTPLAERVGTKALNICCTANTSTLNIIDGSVDWSSQDGGTAAFVGVTQTGGDSRGDNGLHTTNAQVKLMGGTMSWGGTGAVATPQCYGGVMTIENQTGTISTINCYGGTVRYMSTATISQLSMWGNNAAFDAGFDVGAFTVSNADFYLPFRFMDPYRRITWSNDFSIYGDPDSNWNFGANDNAPLVVNFV